MNKSKHESRETRRRVDGGVERPRRSEMTLKQSSACWPVAVAHGHGRNFIGNNTNNANANLNLSILTNRRRVFTHDIAIELEELRMK